MNPTEEANRTFATSRATSAEELQEKSWIEQTFSKRECVKFIPNSPTSSDISSRCGCGRVLSDHHYLEKQGITIDEEAMPLGATAGNLKKIFLKNTPLLSSEIDEEKSSPFGQKREHEGNRWSVSQHTALFHTDAYGVLEFQGSGEGDKSKYLRLSHDTNTDLVLQLLIDEWKVHPPKMVITVHGGVHNFQMQPKLNRVFCKGLIKAANATGAWLMSFGLNTGVGAIVGNALKEHKAKSRGKIVSIGVASWGVVDHREDLVGSQSISSYQTMDNPISKGSVLNAAHTHFLLVDNGTEGQYDSELRFRRHLERRLSQQPLVSRHGRPCPVVCLVLEGGKNTINVVLESVRQSPPIPVIVCDGSGRAADLLAFAHQYTDNNGDMIEELRVQLLVLVQETFKCSKDQAQYIFMSILECVRRKELITIFRMAQGYDENDIDIAILTATLKAQCKSAPDMLNLAMTWNRIDIATSQIFVYGQNWPVMSLEQAMMEALRGDRVEFVKLLMENGVSLHKFLTVARLEELYNSNPPLNLIYLVNDVKKNMPPGYRFTLIDIGLVVEMLMGGAYRSSYTRKRFRLHYSAKSDNGGVRRQMSHKMGLNALGNTSFHKADSFLRSNSYNPSTSRSPKPDAQPYPAPAPQFAYPFHELLVWSVLMKRQKMALFMWQQGEEAIAKALVACKLYKTMAKEAADDDLDVEESDQLRVCSMEFHKLALQMLDVCYRADCDATQHLLTYELKQWSKQTCLSLAVAAKHRDFIAHPCIQLLLNDLWMGGLSERKSSGLKVLCGIFLPPTILTLAFKSREELLLMPQTVEEHLHETSSASSIDGSNHSSSSASTSTSSRSSSSINPKPEVLGRVPTYQAGDAYAMLANRAPQLRLSKKIYEFYNAPITKFWMYVITYSILLGLFTYVVLVKMPSFPSIAEWIVIAHVVTLAIEKVREIVVSAPGGVVQKCRVWGSNFWNCMDTITILMFFIGFGLRMSQQPNVLMIGRLVYCVNIVLWYAHLLNIFSVNKHLGPYVMMIGKMMVDLGTFIILLAVVLVGFGVSRQAILHPHQNASWTLLKDSVLEPYFMLYGEVYAGKIDPCYGDDRSLCVVGSWIAPVFMTIYLLIANILLLNLLIAVFNNTYARVKSYSDKIWKFQRYLSIVEFELRPVFPPPLILISYFFMIFRRICRKGKKSTSDRELKLFLDEEDVEKLHDFEEECVDEFFRSNRDFSPGMLGVIAKPKIDERSVTERLLDTMEDMCEREVVLTSQIIDLHRRLSNIEEISVKLLGRHASGSSSKHRSRQNTGGSEQESQLPVPVELAALSDSNSARVLWSLRRRARNRQDTERSSVGDWNNLLFAGKKKSKPSLLGAERLIRRTTSTDGIPSETNYLRGTQSDTKFGYSTQLSGEKVKAISCQDIHLTNNFDQKKEAGRGFEPSDEEPSDDDDRASSVLVTTPSVCENPISENDLQSSDLKDNSSQCSGVYIKPLENDALLPQAESQPLSSEPCFEMQPLSPSSDEHALLNGTDSSKAKKRVTPIHLTRKSDLPSMGQLESAAPFNGLIQRKFGHATQGQRLSPISARPIYKSITDDIDTSIWHERNQPLTPTTPYECWLKCPDFNSDKQMSSVHHTSLEMEDRESRHKKVVGKHRKHRKRDKHAHENLTNNLIVPDITLSNANNNSTSVTFRPSITRLTWSPDCED